VLRPVSRQKGDADPLNLTERDHVRRITVRRLHAHELDVVQKAIEA